MTQAESLRFLPSSPPGTRLTSRATSILLSAISLVLFTTVLTMSSDRQIVAVVLLVGVAVMLGAIIVLHSRFLLELRSQQKSVVSKLQTTAHDMRLAQQQLRANRAFARSASAEAEALRNTTFTLTSNWQLDHVLDTLLASLAELVPYESARVLLLEDGSRLFVARENFSENDAPRDTEFPLTVDVDDFPLLKRVLKERNPVVLPDVSNNEVWEWRTFSPSLAATRSCLCVPLIAADRALGILCAEHSQTGAFTAEHLRLARSLAVSMAAAIQNVRLYEQAQIYGAELEKLLADLRQTQRALEQAEQQRLVSEDKFEAIFRSSPVAFSITTLEDGRFLDVNLAFEQRYGFSRFELVEHTVFELNFWEDRTDRAFLIAQLSNGNSVRNLITRLRTKSGELRLTAYSASRIRFDGESCVLAVSGDIPDAEPYQMN